MEIMCNPVANHQNIMISMEDMGFTRIREVFNDLINITANFEHDNIDDVNDKITELQSKHGEEIMQINCKYTNRIQLE